MLSGSELYPRWVPLSTELTLCFLTFIIIIRRKKQVEYNSHEHVFAKISYKSRGLTEDSRLSLSTRIILSYVSSKTL